MRECEKVGEYVVERGFKVIETKPSLLYVALGNLYVSFWCPERNYIFDVDPLELAHQIKLDSSDVLIVVAYRPYLIIDELQSVIDRIHRWYGRDLGVKLIGVSSADLDEGLEEAVGHAMVYKPFKMGLGRDGEDVCPNCARGPLRVYASESLFSTKYRGRVNHIVMGCPLCGLRIRRVEILS